MELEALEILLVGKAETRQHYPDAAKVTSHRFLRLRMPISTATYLTDRIVQPSTTYNFPFYFTVPTQLSMGACSHNVETSNTRNHHLQLPPTLGSWERDDMAPELAAITYSIEAYASGKSTTDSSNPRFEACQVVNVIGTTLEDPPLSLGPGNRVYNLQHSCKVGTRLLSPSDGSIKAIAAQPAAIRLTNDGYSASQSAVPVSLTFEPSSTNILPPQQCSISAKIEVQTIYSSEPIRCPPNRGEKMSLYYPYRSKTVSLDPLTVQVQWSQHSSPDIVTEAVGHGRCLPPAFHTATMEMPLQLPTQTKMFLPTFYSCLISRIYTVHLTLNIAGCRLRLSTPVQIIMEPSEVDTGQPNDSTLYAERESGERPCAIEVLPGYYEL
ncbi:hypothetical protein BHE90_014241 [Fusarium euwallaceae]|uniref:Bul1 C-terminal domain-containing protein n=1 Tax=Fusarium euwallaceae TaxID=1147111 RepID=A0A430L6P4_9HYPO|nr:hypothetical protein BHE90_014241 [Fusarium euwallaceae]